jgi:hypothetical protein
MVRARFRAARCRRPSQQPNELTATQHMLAETNSNFTSISYVRYGFIVGRKPSP